MTVAMRDNQFQTLIATLRVRGAGGGRYEQGWDSQIDWERPAKVWGMMMHRPYLIGVHFTSWGDHKGWDVQGRAREGGQAQKQGA